MAKGKSVSQEPETDVKSDKMQALLESHFGKLRTGSERSEGSTLKHQQQYESRSFAALRMTAGMAPALLPPRCRIQVQHQIAVRFRHVQGQQRRYGRGHGGAVADAEVAAHA